MNYINFKTDENANEGNMILYKHILNKIYKDVCIPNNFYCDHIKVHISFQIFKFNNIYYTVDDDYKVIGFLIASEGDVIAMISYLCVDETHRNKGIGTELIKRFTSSLKENSIVRAEVSDTSVFKYFLKNGFNFSGKSICGIYLNMDRKL